MSYLTPHQALELALEHHRAGRLAEADQLYRQLHASDPGSPELVHLIGVAAFHAGQYGAAREWMERSISMNGGVAHYHNNLGTLLIALQDYEGALAAYETVLRLKPDDAGAYYNTGVVRTAQRQWQAAIEAYRAALRLDPDYPACALNLGTALAAAGELEAAIALHRAELQRRPDDWAIAVNLGSLLKEKGDVDGAIEAYRGVLKLQPDNSLTENNLAVALKDQGRIREAVLSFRRSFELMPTNAEVLSNLIFTRLYDPGTELEQIANEQREWNRRHVAPLASSRQPHPNERDPERRLKIGYVSADLRDHVVGRALLPVLERHHSHQVEVVCYSSAPHDETTRRFQARADLWRDIANTSDEQLAALVRSDAIDIFVDLALHTSDNRLRVFARKPAPVQVSWLGYPGSSGVETIDYRLTDPYLEPPGGEVAISGEQPFRLPDCWSCYEPPRGYPAVTELPALAAGRVTFGSLNNFCKINDEVLEVWAQILSAVEGSRLVLLSKAGSHRRRAHDFLRVRGLDPERLQFLDYESASEGRPQGDYLRRYAEIDLALDAFPYNGMTTTCDALWMGVPVISLVGKLSLGRAGLSLLSNVGLGELAVASHEDYVHSAVALARDLPRLAALRATLRERMRASPLLEPECLARNVEAAFRTMWQRWCAEGGTDS